MVRVEDSRTDDRWPLCLRTASHHRNLPVREIAAQLVVEVDGGPAEAEFQAWL